MLVCIAPPLYPPGIQQVCKMQRWVKAFRSLWLSWSAVALLSREATSLFKLDEQVQIMSGLLQVLKTSFGFVAADVLDDVPRRESQAISLNELKRLDRQFFVMIAADLFIKCAHAHPLGAYYLRPLRSSRQLITT